VKPGSTLIYDYSPKSLAEATPSPPALSCAPMVVHHILEVYDLKPSERGNNVEQPEPSSRRNYLAKSKELTDEQEMYLEALKDAGATIKVLSSSGAILAIFKTASAAKQALENIQSRYILNCEGGQLLLPLHLPLQNRSHPRKCLLT